MGVDRTKLRDHQDFDSVRRSKARRFPTKFQHIPAVYSNLQPSRHAATSRSWQIHRSKSRERVRCRFARSTVSPGRQLRLLANQGSSRKNRSLLIWKCQQFYEGCLLLILVANSVNLTVDVIVRYSTVGRT